MTALAELRIMRRLDRSKLSNEAIAYFEKFEQGADYVDSNQARDYVWSDEIIASTIDFCIASNDGEILADGFGSIAEADAARAGAKLTFKLELPQNTVAPSFPSDPSGY